MKKNKTLVFITESAIMIALATVLSSLPIWHAPLGGTVTVCSMLPIMYISFRYGVGGGLACGFVYSIVQLIQGMDNLGYIPSIWGILCCIALDYILPFTLIGLAGLFYRKGQSKGKKIFNVVLGVLLACVLRFGCHYLVGAITWHALTKTWEEDGHIVFKYGKWVYSLIYNVSYLAPDFAIVLAASPVIPFLDDALDKSLNK